MPASPPVSRETFGTELSTYRLVCFLAAGLIPLFGIVLLHVDPTFYDPLPVRWALGGLVAVYAVSTYLSAWVRAHLESFAVVISYVVVAWFTVLLAANNLAPEYAVGYLFTITMMGVANLGARKLWATIALITLTAGAGVGVALLLPAPAVSPLVFVLCSAASGVVISAATFLRLHANDRADESDLRARAIFETATDGLFLADLHTLRIVHANRAFLSATGYTLDELGQRPLSDFVDASRADVQRWTKALREDEQIRLREVRWRRKSGYFLPLSVGAARIEEQGRELLCATVHDLTEYNALLTESREAKERAEEMLRLKTSFLNNMSHELRTPLVSIFGFAEILTEETDEELREIAGTIHRSARRLYDTLNAVLDLAQLESGGVHFDPEVVDISAAAEAVASRLRPSAQEKGLAFRLRTAPDIRVLASGSGLERVLTHLVTNAIKFTDRGGIGVDIEADSHRVLVRVTDTGIGIAEEFLPRLFDAFEQASTGMDRVYEGSGLGLAVTKQLVDLMGGRIMVDSVPGEGTCFVVAFARVWPDPEEATTAPDAVSGDGASGNAPPVAPLVSRPRVLVVEDNADTRRLIAHTLEPHFDVITAENAHEALALATKAWFDALLLDVDLGAGRNGIELLHALREMSAYAYVPAIAATVHTGPGDRDRLLKHGFDAYLAKPFTRHDMLDVFNEALAGHTV